MATTKQIAMMSARANEAGMKVSKSELAELDNGGVDQMLERIRVYGKEKEGATGKFKEPDRADINNARFGMCVKIVVDQYGLEFLSSRPDYFQKQVNDLYALVGDISLALQEGRAASLVDPDASAEATETMQLEAEEVI